MELAEVLCASKVCEYSKKVENPKDYQSKTASKSPAIGCQTDYVEYVEEVSSALTGDLVEIDT